MHPEIEVREGRTKHVAARMPETMYAGLRKLAAVEDRSISSLLRTAVARQLFECGVFYEVSAHSKEQHDGRRSR